VRQDVFDGAGPAQPLFDIGRVPRRAAGGEQLIDV